MSIRRAQTQDIPDILRLLVQVNMVHHKARPDLFKGPATKYSAAELEEILRDDEKPVFVYTEGDKFLGYIFCQTEITMLPCMYGAEMTGQRLSMKRWA